MYTLKIELTDKDIKNGNAESILQEVGQRIDEGFTSGIGFPVDWELVQTIDETAEDEEG